MEQVMELLLAKVDSFQEEMKTNGGKMDANRAEMMARMESNTVDNLKEMKEAIRTNQEITDTTIKEIIAEIRAWRKERTTCQEAMVASLEIQELTSVQIESVAVHEEVPTKGAL
jgi:hypothetical protein